MNNITELVFILDRSGSMSGLEKDTIGGFNSMIKKQKEEAGKAVVTTVLFDHEYELLHDRKMINEMDPITQSDYFVRGSTALLDAIGKTINKIGYEQKLINEKLRADKILFVITTDGMENASSKFSYHEVSKMITHQKEKHGWEFLFLGANIDALKTAESFGIEKERAVNYCADEKGTSLNYEVLNKTVSNYRKSKSIDDNWKLEIDLDYQKRSEK